MEIKISREIESEIRKLVLSANSITEIENREIFLEKRWVAVDDLIKYLREFPTKNYSSKTINRGCADADCRKIILEILDPLEQPPVKQEKVKK